MAIAEEVSRGCNPKGQRVLVRYPSRATPAVVPNPRQTANTWWAKANGFTEQRSQKPAVGAVNGVQKRHPRNPMAMSPWSHEVCSPREFKVDHANWKAQQDSRFCQYRQRRVAPQRLGLMCVVEKARLDHSASVYPINGFISTQHEKGPVPTRSAQASVFAIFQRHRHQSQLISGGGKRSSMVAISLEHWRWVSTPR